MRWHRGFVTAAALLGTAIVSSPAYGQGHGGGGMGMGGMMGMGRDSATRAQMSVVHELLFAHDRITRTVTRLPDGIRTLTESDDPEIARLIKEHVLTMNARVFANDDPGLPMESEALHAIFRNSDKIRTWTEMTAKGIFIVQTSSDAAMVAALQQHASEVSDLADRGMMAMREAMMKNRGMSGPGPHR
jgi:hypothetical protein